MTPPPDHRVHAWRDHGLRVDLWNVLDILEKLDRPANHLVNSLLYTDAPDLMDRISIRNHPMADKVCFARPSNIADHILALPEGTLPCVPAAEGWRGR